MSTASTLAHRAHREHPEHPCAPLRTVRTVRTVSTVSTVGHPGTVSTVSTVGHPGTVSTLEHRGTVSTLEHRGTVSTLEHRGTVRACLTMALLVAVTMPLSGQQATSSTPGVRRVLVLFSYEQGTVWSDAIVKGFRDGIEDSETAIDVWFDYLDVNRRSDPPHLQRKLATIEADFRQNRFDLVVACDDAAIGLVADHLDTVFRSLPVIACGINEPALLDRFPPGRVTGMVEVYTPSRMPDLAVTLRPGTRRFFVITDDSSTGASIHNNYRAYAATRPDLEFVFLDGRERSLDDIVAALESTGENDAILISSFLRDKDGRHYPRHSAIRRMVDVAGAPFYSPLLSTLGQGLMVGLENRGYSHGRWAARRALEWLAEPGATMPRSEQEPVGRVVADVAVLERWGVTRRLLPPDTILLNEPSSFYRANKTLVWSAATLALIQTAAIAMLAINIRRRRRAEDALRARSEHLERTLAELEQARLERLEIEERMRQGERLESMGRLAGGIAHDFNNLLTVIMSYAELARLSAPPGSDQAGQIEQIQLAGRSAADLTRQILAFSRKQVLQPAIVDVNALVRESHGMITRLLGAQVTARLYLGDGLPPVRIDRTQLQQALINLAVNARDAMPDGGVLSLQTSVVDLDDASISTHPTMTPGRYVVVAVSDTGTGMSREVLDRIFDPFFTTKPKGRGTGLGLASVYGTVKQSGGWIWAYSEEGRGTTFKIHFPALRAEPPDTAPDVTTVTSQA
jgi:signal transduction histidine kinase